LLSSTEGLSMLNRSLALTGVLALAACAAPARDASKGQAMQAASMIPAMTRHLDSVAAAPGMLHAAMPDHEQRLHALMAAMHDDMTHLGLPSDPAYEALADSTVADLGLMEKASGPEYDRLAAAHVEHVRRLMAAYEAKAGQPH
jgi:hypothetical protein